MHLLNYIFAYHIDSTTLTDGNYELIPKSEVEISEDPGNIVGNLTKAPNQSSENFTLLPPTPLMKVSPGHNPLLYLHCNLYLFIPIYALSS
jgi:hypothetical protein